jgi:hypothetical protein
VEKRQNRSLPDQQSQSGREMLASEERAEACV